MHSFSGTLEWAEKFVELGMIISFSGVVTFKKATDIQEAARELPLDKILVETDAPYLALFLNVVAENKTAYTCYVVRFYRGFAWHDDKRTGGSNDCKCRTNFGLDSK